MWKRKGKLIIIINYSQVLLILIIHVIDHHLNHYHYGLVVLRLEPRVCVNGFHIWCAIELECICVGRCCAHTGACVNISSEWVDRGVSEDWILYQLLAVMLCIVSRTMKSKSVIENSKSWEWTRNRAQRIKKEKNCTPGTAPNFFFVISFWLRSCFSNWLKNIGKRNLRQKRTERRKKNVRCSSVI